MNSKLIERTLIVMPEPIKKILKGRKKWEIRTQPTKIRGRIALSEKGAKRIVGTCELVDCVGPLTGEEYIANYRKMGLTDKNFIESIDDIVYEITFGIYAWILKDVKQLKTPVSFENPSGAVTWARLPPQISRKLSKA